MEIESDPVDPLHALSGLSLFPRTIRALGTAAPLPPDPKDLESIHQFMKSVTLSRPERLLDEAKAIVDGGSELLNSHYAAFLESIGIDKDNVGPNVKEKPRERRHGLGRKRARFTLKPETSQPSVSLEPEFNIDNLGDPEEFFAAFEKFENARKEIQRQKGGPASDLYDYDAARNARRRRPGLLGKSVSYKHRYASVPLESNDMLASPQETTKQDVPGLPTSEMQQDTSGADVETEEIEMPDLITRTEKQIDKLLVELLSKDENELEGDGALTILQEQLQIKPVAYGNIFIPDFPETGRTDFKALGELLPKARKSNSSTSNLVKKLDGEINKKHNKVAESLTNPTTSPTPPRSPFTSISLLKKSFSQSNPLRDPFSPLNIDLSEPRMPYSVEEIDKQSDVADVIKDLSTSANLRSYVEDENTTAAISDLDIQRVLNSGSHSLTHKSMDKNQDDQTRIVDACSSGSHENHAECYTAMITEDNNLTNDPDKQAEKVWNSLETAISSQKTSLCDSNLLKSGNGSDVQAFQSSHAEKNVADIPSDAACSPYPDVNIHKSTSLQNPIETLALESANPASSEERAFKMPSTTIQISGTKVPKVQKRSQKNKRRRKALARKEVAPIQKQPRKNKSLQNETRERREVACGATPEDAGTSFESGVRRSRRIRTRPLEFWKGERLLYGRVNKSLELIGLKYISPAKGYGNMKVKSYVSDEYKEILELAALH